MHGNLTDQIAHDHITTLICDAAQVRRARQAGAYRAQRHGFAASISSAGSAGHRRLRRPFAAVHDWLLSQ